MCTDALMKSYSSNCKQNILTSWRVLSPEREKSGKRSERFQVWEMEVWRDGNQRKVTSCFQTPHAVAPCYCRSWRCCLIWAGSRVIMQEGEEQWLPTAGVRTLVTREKSNYSRDKPPFIPAVPRSAWGSEVTLFHRGLLAAAGLLKFSENALP